MGSKISFLNAIFLLLLTSARGSFTAEGWSSDLRTEGSGVESTFSGSSSLREPAQLVSGIELEGLDGSQGDELFQTARSTLPLTDPVYGGGASGESIES